MTGVKSTGPLFEDDRMSELETVFTRRSVRVTVHRTGPLWKPPTDVFETEDALVIVVEIAGMHGGEFNVSLQNRILTITGMRQGAERPNSFHQMEIHYGEFRTDIELPHAVDAKSVEADYNDGFLHVVLPKKSRETILVNRK